MTENSERSVWDIFGGASNRQVKLEGTTSADEGDDPSPHDINGGASSNAERRRQRKASDANEASSEKSMRALTAVDAPTAQIGKKKLQRRRKKKVPDREAPVMTSPKQKEWVIPDLSMFRLKFKDARPIKVEGQSPATVHERSSELATPLDLSRKLKTEEDHGAPLDLSVSADRKAPELSSLCSNVNISYSPRKEPITASLDRTRTLFERIGTAPVLPSNVSRVSPVRPHIGGQPALDQDHSPSVARSISFPITTTSTTPPAPSLSNVFPSPNVVVATSHRDFKTSKITLNIPQQRLGHMVSLLKSPPKKPISFAISKPLAEVRPNNTQVQIVSPVNSVIIPDSDENELILDSPSKNQSSNIDFPMDCALAIASSVDFDFSNTKPADDATFIDVPSTLSPKISVAKSAIIDPVIISNVDEPILISEDDDDDDFPQYPMTEVSSSAPVQGSDPQPVVSTSMCDQSPAPCVVTHLSVAPVASTMVSMTHASEQQKSKPSKYKICESEVLLKSSDSTEFAIHGRAPSPPLNALGPLTPHQISKSPASAIPHPVVDDKQISTDSGHSISIVKSIKNEELPPAMAAPAPVGIDVTPTGMPSEPISHHEQTETVAPISKPVRDSASNPDVNPAKCQPLPLAKTIEALNARVKISIPTDTIKTNSSRGKPHKPKNTSAKVLNEVHDERCELSSAPSQSWKGFFSSSAFTYGKAWRRDKFDIRHTKYFKSLMCKSGAPFSSATVNKLIEFSLPKLSKMKHPPGHFKYGTLLPELWKKSLSEYKTKVLRMPPHLVYVPPKVPFNFSFPVADVTPSLPPQIPVMPEPHIEHPTKIKCSGKPKTVAIKRQRASLNSARTTADALKKKIIKQDLKPKETSTCRRVKTLTVKNSGWATSLLNDGDYQQDISHESVETNNIYLNLGKKLAPTVKLHEISRVHAIYATSALSLSTPPPSIESIVEAQAVEDDLEMPHLTKITPPPKHRQVAKKSTGGVKKSLLKSLAKREHRAPITNDALRSDPPATPETKKEIHQSETSTRHSPRLSPKRRKRAEEKRSMRKKRSLLDELASSAGYVAEKKVEKRTDDLLVDPSQLSREEKALQRAFIRFREMEMKKSDQNSPTQPPVQIKRRAESSACLKAKQLKKQAMIGREQKAAKRRNFVDFIPAILESRLRIKTRAEQFAKGQAYQKATQKRKFNDSPPKPEVHKPSKLRKTAVEDVSRQDNTEDLEPPEPVVYIDNGHSDDESHDVPGSQFERTPFFSIPRTTAVEDDARSVSTTTSSGCGQKYKGYIPPEVKKIVICYNTGETVLHKAARLGYDDVCLWCCQMEYVPVDAADNGGYTALHESCAYGHVRITKYLLAYGADPHVASKLDGERPLLDAVDRGHMEVARVLLSVGADPFMTTYSGKNAMQLAKGKKMKEFMNAYLIDLNGVKNSRDRESAWDVYPYSHWFKEERDEDDDSDDEEEEESGFDVLADPPDDPPSDSEELFFDFSDEPPVPTFSLCFDEDDCPRNYAVLSDALFRLGLTKRDLEQQRIGLVTRKVLIEDFMDQLSVFQEADATNALNTQCDDQINVELILMNKALKDIMGYHEESLPFHETTSHNILQLTNFPSVPSNLKVEKESPPKRPSSRPRSVPPQFVEIVDDASGSEPVQVGACEDSIASEPNCLPCESVSSSVVNQLSQAKPINLAPNNQTWTDSAVGFASSYSTPNPNPSTSYGVAPTYVPQYSQPGYSMVQYIPDTMQGFVPQTATQQYAPVNYAWHAPQATAPYHQMPSQYQLIEPVPLTVVPVYADANQVSPQRTFVTEQAAPEESYGIRISNVCSLVHDI